MASLFGLLSLLMGVRSWQERRHLDLELLIGLVDAVLVLGLAYALARRSTAAAWLLLGLASFGLLYTLWSGLPAVSILPHVIGGVLYARAIAALRFLRRNAA